MHSPPEADTDCATFEEFRDDDGRLRRLHGICVVGRSENSGSDVAVQLGDRYRRRCVSRSGGGRQMYPGQGMWRASAS